MDESFSGLEKVNRQVIKDVFFFSSRRRHTRWNCDWSSDVCSSDLRSSASTLRLSRATKPTGLPLSWRFPPRETHELPGRETNCPRRGTTSPLWSCAPSGPHARSEERRVGKECRSGWWQDH